MALWSKKAPQPYGGSGTLGLGPGYATQIPPEKSARWEPGVLDPSPDPTIHEQWGMLNHYRLTNDMTGNDWDRNRVRRSKRQETYNHADEGPTSSVPFKEKQRNEVYWNPPRNQRKVTTPSNYQFVRRWFFEGKERFFNGNHFSMATHARTYEIYGMNPAHPEKRNTYRAEPPPRDVFVEDRGSFDSYAPPYATRVSPTGGGGIQTRNSFRLD